MPLKLTIDNPCHENWQHMEPNKEGRHCQACRKTVVDFSAMTDKEILDFISHSQGDLCGRFDGQQLNRHLHETKPRRKLSWFYIWNVVIAGFLWTGKAKAQGTVCSEKTGIVEQKEMPATMGMLVTYTEKVKEGITGKVINEVTGEPVPFASIVVERGGGRSTQTDTTGNFFVEKDRRAATRKITVSAIGFVSQTIWVNKSGGGNITVYLQPEVIELPPVEVSAIAGKKKEDLVACLQGTVGAYAIVVPVTKTEKLTRTVKEWFPKKDVITYPNPLAPGSTMHVALELKEAGEYRMELIDAAGKVLWIQSMNIPNRKYNLTIPTQNTWSAGVYWLRISGRHTKNVYNSRVVIQ